jgi:hypothetical protein
MNNKEDKVIEAKIKRAAARMRYKNSPKGFETIARIKREQAAKESPDEYADRIINGLNAREQHYDSCENYYTDRLW